MKFWTGDIETWDGLLGQEFAVGCITDGNKVVAFSSAEDMFRFMIRYTKRIYFHNMNFDIRFFLQHCIDNGIPFEPPIVRNGRILSQRFLSRRCGTKKKYVKCIDSFALMPLSLGQIAKIYQVGQKLDVDFSNASYNDLLKRCTSDVTLLHKSICGFFKLFPHAQKCITLPQTAMREFVQQNNEWCFTVSRDKNEKHIMEKEEEDARAGYYGGRTEIFDLNKYDNVRCYDVNSLYPYVMRKNLFPVSMVKLGKRALEYDLYLVRARVTVPYCYIPLLPVKTTKLMFTTGTFEGWFYSPEFELVRDEIDYEILDGYAFDGKYIFREFIDKYWKLRKEFKEKKDPREKMIKLYMNSLYGKFGQRREAEVVSWTTEPYADAEELTDGMYVMRQKEFSSSAKINPFISGFITSYARAHLYTLLNEDVIYCDTDSVFTTKILNESDELGGLKLESKGVFKAYVPKVYYYNTDKGPKHKAKGVFRANIPQCEDENEFVNAVRKTVKTTFAQPIESMRRFGRFVATKQVEKVLSFKYDKRKVLSDLKTEPYDYAEVVCCH